MEIQIRPFELTDKDPVVELWNEVLPTSSPHSEPSKAIELKLAFQKELFFVAVAESAVAGTVMGGYDGHRGWIYSLAVVPKFQRSGVGTALVQHVEGELARLGCLKINLQIRSSNKAVVDFYTKRGYQLEDWVGLGKRLY